MSALQNAWYNRAVWVWLLAPFTLLFWLLSALRRKFYKIGLFSSKKAPVPVIVVGNISVGGNGKTPLVMYLCRWLKQQGYRPGVVSRGYGGSARNYPLLVNSELGPEIVGDEPAFMAQQLNCPIVIDPIRSRGASALANDHGCDIVICDDGLQHYALQRDVEIAVVDGERRIGNGYLLPMGPLREGAWRLEAVDFVVVNGGHATQNEYLMSLEPGHLVNVKYPNQSKSLSEVASPAIAAAGIGNPERFFSLLEQKGVKIKERKAFPDHHAFCEKDLPEELVLMTEKDAVKCRDFAKEQWWYLPVTANLTEQFKAALLKNLKAIKSN